MAVVSNTKLFNVRSSIDYYNPIKDIGNNQFYVFTAKSLQWSNSTPLPITDSVVETDYTIFDELLFGKIVTPNDAIQMVNRYDWTSGTVYARYDDEDQDLFTKMFFVVSYENGAYHVFKCLDNAVGAQSTSQPLLSQTSANDDAYYTADGYHWKYMYSIDTSTYNKFTTTDYIPVVPNTFVSQYASNGAIDAIFVTSGGNNYVSYANGYFSQVSVGGNTLVHALTNGSSNNGFYSGSALYISSGTGSGQVRKITGYTVTANQYQVSVDSVFNPQPDLSSQFSISPYVNILGDGAGAMAVAVVNTTTQSIQSINMISGGNNYSYANVYVIGNTGTLVANSSSVRAVMSPHGGHGFNPASELNANKLGISVTYANSEANSISTQNDYSRIGLLKNPTYSTVQVTYNSNTGAFTPSEHIIQATGVNTSLRTFTSTVQSYSYMVGNYVSLTFNQSTSLVANDTIYQNSPAANGTVISISGNTAIVRKDYGTFTTTSQVYKTGNNLVNNSINAVSSGFTNTVFGLDSSNTLFAFSATNAIDVYINGSKLYNHGVLPSNTPTISYSVNSTAVQLWNKTLSNTDIVSVRKYVTTAVLANTQYTATGTLQSSNSTVLVLNSVSGVFTTGAQLSGTQSGATANVSAVAQATETFSQTLVLTGTYQPGSNTFSLDNYCQQDTPGVNGAFGYIQSIYSYGNGTYDFALSNVKGVFEAGGSKTIQSVSGDKIVSVSAIKKQPDLIKYTGDIVYAENITSVSRSNTQSETIKLVLNFY
jgi:hypothetical protein